MENTDKVRRISVLVILLALLVTSSIITITIVNHHHVDEQPDSPLSPAEPPIALAQTFENLNKLSTSINVTTEGQQDIAVDPNTNTVYVIHNPNRPIDDLSQCQFFPQEEQYLNISVINGTTNRMVRNVTLGGFNGTIAVNPNTNMVYVAAYRFDENCRDTSILHVIDAKKNNYTVTNTTIGTEFKPIDIAVNPVTNRIYLVERYEEHYYSSDFDSVQPDRILEIDGGHANKTILSITTIEEGYAVEKIAVSQNTSMVYLVSNTSNLYVINGSDNRPSQVPMLYTPYDIEVNPETNTVYVTDNTGSRISVINGTTNNVTKTLMNNFTGSIRANLAVDNTENMVYVLRSRTFDPFTITDIDTVSVINGATNSIVNNFDIKDNGGALNLDINPKNNTIYILSSAEDHSIYVYSTKDAISNEQQRSTGEGEPAGVKVESKPFDIAVNPTTNKIYVIYDSLSAISDNRVSVIDGNKGSNIRNISIGKDPPNVIEADPEANRIYLASHYNNSLIEIDGNTDKNVSNDIIPNINRSAGVHPIDIAINPKTSMIYILTTPSNNPEDFNQTIYAKNGLTDKFEKYLKRTLDNFEYGYITDLALDTNTDTLYTAEYYGGFISAIEGLDLGGAYAGSKPTSLDFDSGSSFDSIHDMPPSFDTPSIIAVNPNTNMLYVIYDAFEKISEADGYTGKITRDFNFTTEASNAAVNPNTNMLYVTSDLSNSVRVFDLTTTAEVANVSVGVRPVALDINPETNMIYVANYESDTVSVIDGHTYKVVAGVTFNINPSGSGRILCNTQNTTSSRIGEYIYVDSGAQCTARPNEGFEFSSWEENLGSNATQIINVSSPASSLDSYLEYLRRDKSADKPESTLYVTKFGTFTANFKEAPLPLPPEFWAQMYAVIATVITALFIPSIVGWIRSKQHVNKLNYYHKEIASLYDDGKLDENDMEALDQLRIRVSNAYSEGKVNEKHYESLRSEISTLYEEIFRKKIAALDGKNSNYSVDKRSISIQEQLAHVKDQIEYAFSKGKINKKHYDLLTRAISNLDGKENASQ